MKNEELRMRSGSKRYAITLLSVLLSTGVYAESIDADLEGFDDSTGSSQLVSTSTTQIAQSNDDMAGFDDEPAVSGSTEDAPHDEIMDGFDDDSTGSSNDASISSATDVTTSEETVTEPAESLSGFTGKLTEQVAYSWHNKAPHDNISSLKSSLLLDYEHKFENGIRFKTNAKAYYDAIYSLKNRGDFTSKELSALESEVELFDAYLEGSITDSLDYKVGRQVVVWGRSDTIRITDVLNPLDNRRPGMVDIEDLRLPVVMAKFDYFIGDWRLTPIAILEQRFTKNPPFGGDFYPFPIQAPSNESYNDVTYALSVGAEFSGWDVNFYAARLRDDAGYLALEAKPVFKHDKVNMFGTALNVLSGSWLFKTEIAHFSGLKYFSTGDETFERTDGLVGVEYNGIADTLISYDFALRTIHGYDKRLLAEQNPLNKYDYQHAFRVTSDFVNDTVHANYLISLYGKHLDEGGFQRAWIKYDLADGINVNVGVVDYIGGSVLFDAIKDNDMVFADISYSF